MVDRLTQLLRRLHADVTTNRLAWLGFGLALVVLVLDQVSKWVVIGPLGFSPDGCLAHWLGQISDAQLRAAILADGRERACGHIDFGPVFDLTMVWNTGVAFGLLSAETLADRIKLVVGALAISAGLAVWISRCSRPLATIAAGMIFGGAIGNIIDRIRFGAVVDFLNFAGGSVANPGGGWFGWALPANAGPLAWVDGAMFNGDGQLGIGFPYVFNVADMGVSLGVALLLLDWFLEERRAKVGDAQSVA